MGIDVNMAAIADRQINDDKVRLLSYRLGAAVGSGNFFIDRDREWGGKLGTILEPVAEFLQDGEPIYPEPGQTILQVQTPHRYYGPGYERGPWPVIRAIGDWLEYNVGTVWYGGDSSGVLAKSWSEIAPICQKHWLAEGSLPYRTNPLWELTPVERRLCGLCRQPMSQYLWSGIHKVGVFCPGCGLKEITNDGGETWERITQSA